jgi:hypothetical protein
VKGHSDPLRLKAKRQIQRPTPFPVLVLTSDDSHEAHSSPLRQESLSCFVNVRPSTSLPSTPPPYRPNEFSPIVLPKRPMSYVESVLNSGSPIKSQPLPSPSTDIPFAFSLRLSNEHSSPPLPSSPVPSSAAVTQRRASLLGFPDCGLRLSDNFLPSVPSSAPTVPKSETFAMPAWFEEEKKQVLGRLN